MGHVDIHPTGMPTEYFACVACIPDLVSIFICGIYLGIPHELAVVVCWIMEFICKNVGPI